jgi:hypothetical protein
MTDQTTEVPLTKSQRNHLENIQRRDAKRRRKLKKDQDKEARDAKLAAINERFLPQIAKLQQQHRLAVKAVWDEWHEERSAS